VTPYGMERSLEERLKKTQRDYENFIKESEKDAKEWQKEIQNLQKEYEKEKLISEKLQSEVDRNQKELD
jgi:hypothetical protein